ncbi:hypothetical protein JS609_01599 [Bacillus subtilis]|nr:hypothetical protein JS609_01599 [Bacillus subtilis]
MQLTELSIKNQNVFVQHYIDGKEEMSSFLITVFIIRTCGAKEWKTYLPGFSQERNWRRT